MRIRVHTRAGDTVEYLDASGSLELKIGDESDNSPRWWLSDVSEISVSEHQPLPPPAPTPRLVEREVDTSVYAYTHNKPGERVRVGPKRSFRTLAADLEPPPKPKPKAKAKR